MAEMVLNDKSNESAQRYWDVLSGSKNTLNGLIQKMEEFKKLKEEMYKSSDSFDVIDGISANNEEVLKQYAASLAGNDADGENLIAYIRSIMGQSLDELTLKIREVKMNLSVTKDPESQKKYRKELDMLENQYTEKAKNGSPKKTSPEEEWNEFSTIGKNAVKTISDGVNGFNDLDEASKAALGAVGTVITETFKGIDQIVSLSTSSAKAVEGTAGVAAKSMSSVEKASAILAIISVALKIASTIANLLGDGAKEKKIQDIKGTIDNLSIAYERLGKSLEGTYASDSVKILEKQNDNLLQQKKLVEEQMALEDSKKKTDNKKMNDYQKSLNKIDDDIKANQNQMIKSIIGKDVKDAINDFSTAYVNAWDAGTDKAKAMKDVVKSMIKSAIGEFVKARLSGEVEKFTQYLATAMADGVIDATEQAKLDELESAIVKKGDELDSQLSWAKEDVEPDRSASSKGIAQASQESIDDLSGRITNIQGHTYYILEEVRKQGFNNQEILSQIRLINESATHLRRLEVIEKRIGSMDSNINDVVLKGVKLNGK